MHAKHMLIQRIVYKSYSYSNRPHRIYIYIYCIPVYIFIVYSVYVYIPYLYTDPLHIHIQTILIYTLYTVYSSI